MKTGDMAVNAKSAAPTQRDSPVRAMRRNSPRPMRPLMSASLLIMDVFCLTAGVAAASSEPPRSASPSGPSPAAPGAALPAAVLAPSSRGHGRGRCRRARRRAPGNSVPGEAHELRHCDGRRAVDPHMCLVAAVLANSSEKVCPAALSCSKSPSSMTRPWSSTKMRSAASQNWSWFVRKSTAQPAPRKLFRMHSSKTARPTCASIADSGSSRMTKSGLAKRARASATRARWPPLMVIPFSPISVRSPSESCRRSCSRQHARRDRR
mmetsp:Transcript_62100/g.195954  ORF Transcript_62100/g.195954 Transcript_62100/m.195954 type:complete len:265 (-) Transcript_62100:8-802(-)